MKGNRKLKSPEELNHLPGSRQELDQINRIESQKKNKRGLDAIKTN
jgi:hypothetical protein